jgi:hypothetical protein
MDDLRFRKRIGITELSTVQATVPKILKPLDRRLLEQVLVRIPKRTFLQKCSLQMISHASRDASYVG